MEADQVDGDEDGTIDSQEPAACLNSPADKVAAGLIDTRGCLMGDVSSQVEEGVPGGCVGPFDVQVLIANLELGCQTGTKNINHGDVTGKGVPELDGCVDEWDIGKIIKNIDPGCFN